MMNDNANVTMPLNDFDELRENMKNFLKLAPRIAKCFEYNCEELPEPAECKKCNKEDPDCTKCEVYKANPPYKETLTVDVEQLITVCKQYALYGKDVVGVDLKNMTIIKKKTLKNKQRGVLQ